MSFLISSPFSHATKPCNLLFSLVHSITFVHVKTTLTDFLSSFPQLVLHQYLHAYSNSKSCPFLLGYTSISTLKILLFPPFSLVVASKSSTQYPRVSWTYSNTTKLVFKLVSYFAITNTLLCLSPF